MTGGEGSHNSAYNKWGTWVHSQHSSTLPWALEDWPQGCIAAAPSGLHSATGRHQQEVRGWEVGILIPLAPILHWWLRRNFHDNMNRSIILFIPQVLSPNDSSSSSFLSFSTLSYLRPKFIWKPQSGIGGTLLPWEECDRSRSSSLPAPFGIRRGARFALSFSTNILLGDFVLASFFPRLTPWMVAVAVILVVLGLLTIGSIFFTWRLYKERSRQRRNEFSSKGKS